MFLSILLFSPAFATPLPVTPAKNYTYNNSAASNLCVLIPDKVKNSGKKYTWFKRLKAKIYASKFIRLAIPETGEITTAKKILSVLSLGFGILSMVLLFALGNAFVFALIGAFVTGIVALIGNRSKKHKLMALGGILLAITALAILVILVASAF